MVTVPLVNVVRGPLVESSHRGVVALVDTEGNLRAKMGLPAGKTYIRSSAKPAQVLPLLVLGAAEKYDLTDRELALMCASHNGEDIHVETARGILKKAGLSEEDLECGTHLPYDRESAKALMARGEEVSPIYSNCSGKHAGMLLLCQHMGWPTEGYVRAEHPLQQLMHETIAELAELSTREVDIGIDGCGVVVFGFPVEKMAFLFARLAHPQSLPASYQEAAERVSQAMVNEPYMVAGRNRLCTDLMEATRGKLISKGGAEGVYCIGLKEREQGLAIKIEDGNSRGLGTIVFHILEALEILNDDEKKQLEKYRLPVIKNRRGDAVGKIKTCFDFKKVAKEMRQWTES